MVTGGAGEDGGKEGTERVCGTEEGGSEARGRAGQAGLWLPGSLVAYPVVGRQTWWW